MKISSLVSTLPTPLVMPKVDIPVPEGAAGLPPAHAAVPSFITPASLISTSGGTAAVNVLWSVAKQLFPTVGTSPWLPFACARFIGAVIYGTALSDKNTQLSVTEKLTGAAIAFINSMVLFAAAIGIQGVRPS